MEDKVIQDDKKKFVQDRQYKKAGILFSVGFVLLVVFNGIAVLFAKKHMKILIGGMMFSDLMYIPEIIGLILMLSYFAKSLKISRKYHNAYRSRLIGGIITVSLLTAAFGVITCIGTAKDLNSTNSIETVELRENQLLTVYRWNETDRLLNYTYRRVGVYKTYGIFAQRLTMQTFYDENNDDYEITLGDKDNEYVLTTYLEHKNQSGTKKFCLMK